jgi:hypothetical protein
MSGGAGGEVFQSLICVGRELKDGSFVEEEALFFAAWLAVVGRWVSWLSDCEMVVSSGRL